MERPRPTKPKGLSSPLPHMSTSSSPEHAIWGPQEPSPGKCRKIPGNSGLEAGLPVRQCRTETFPEELQGPPSRTHPSGTDPPEPLCPDLIRTRFRPDFDLIRVISGPNQVETRSKWGPNQVWAEGFSWVGARGVGPGGRVPVAPRKVSSVGRKSPIQGIPRNSFWGTQMGILGWFSLADGEWPKLICWARGRLSELVKSWLPSRRNFLDNCFEVERVTYLPRMVTQVPKVLTKSLKIVTTSRT